MARKWVAILGTTVIIHTGFTALRLPGN